MFSVVKFFEKKAERGWSLFDQDPLSLGRKWFLVKEEETHFSVVSYCWLKNIVKHRYIKEESFVFECKISNDFKEVNIISINPRRTVCELNISLRDIFLIEEMIKAWLFEYIVWIEQENSVNLDPHLCANKAMDGYIQSQDKNDDTLMRGFTKDFYHLSEKHNLKEVYIQSYSYGYLDVMFSYYTKEMCIEACAARFNPKGEIIYCFIGYVQPKWETFSIPMQKSDAQIIVLDVLNVMIQEYKNSNSNIFLLPSSSVEDNHPHI